MMMFFDGKRLDEWQLTGILEVRDSEVRGAT